MTVSQDKNFSPNYNSLNNIFKHINIKVCYKVKQYIYCYINNAIL